MTATQHIEVKRGVELIAEHRVGLDREITVGRGDSAHIVLTAPEVSRRHASLQFDRDSVRVADHSHNGVFVGGRPISGQRRLPVGEAIDIGPFTLVLGQARENEAERLLAFKRQVLEQLIAHVDLAAVRERSTDLRPRVEAVLERVALELGLPEAMRIDDLVKTLADEALGLGPLEPLLADEAVTEIMVIDPFTIFAERMGRLEKTALSFTSENAVRTVIDRIIAPLGRRVDELSPMVDARLADGSRVNAVVPPLAIRGASITIRKFTKKPLGMADLIGFGSMSEEMATLLERAVCARANIVISGGTGSGKTTLLGALAGAIPGTERIVTIEDAAELRLPQTHVVSLESRPPNAEGKGEVTIRDLVRNALRMRPDRIVVGECRGGEALDMLQAMNTGHDGSLTTTHANSPAEAVSRLETLALMAGLDLPARAIREQIAHAIDLIVQQTRLADGSRRITAIAEVLGMEDDGSIGLNEIFRYLAPDTPNGEGTFLATGWLPHCLGQSFGGGAGESNAAGVS
jgi:pilus assembly protein CpaF